MCKSVYVVVGTRGVKELYCVEFSHSAKRALKSPSIMHYLWAFAINSLLPNSLPTHQFIVNATTLEDKK